jgi:hypothetical protein
LHVQALRPAQYTETPRCLYMVASQAAP